MNKIDYIIKNANNEINRINLLKKRRIGKIIEIYPNQIIIELNNYNNILNSNINQNDYILKLESINQFLIVHNSNSNKLLLRINNIRKKEYDFNYKNKIESKYLITNEKKISKESLLNYERFFISASALLEWNYYKSKNYVYNNINNYPNINQNVYLINKEEFNLFFEKANQDLEIGNIKLNSFLFMKLKINTGEIISSHKGIFGCSGSGKSSICRELYYRLYEKIINIEKFNNNFRILFLDSNNEYNKMIETIKEKNPNIIKKLNLEECYIEFSSLKFEHIKKLFNASDLSQVQILKQAVYLAQYIEKNEFNNYFQEIIFHIKVAYNSSQDFNIRRSLILQLIKYIYDYEEKIETIIHCDNCIKNFDCLKNFENVFKKIFHYEFPKLKKLNSYPYERFYNDDEFEKNFINFINHWSKTERIENKNYLENFEIKCSFNNLKINFELAMLFSKTNGNYKIYEMNDFLKNRINDFINYKFIFEQITEKKCKKSNLISILNDENMKFKIFHFYNKSDLNNNVIEFIYDYINSEILDYNRINIKNNENKINIWNIVIDEAHKYIKNSSENLKMNTQNIYEKIAREGRKFSIYLTLISQQIMDISDVILSQINNFWINRINNNDELQKLLKNNSLLSEQDLLNIPYLTEDMHYFISTYLYLPLRINLKMNPILESKISETKYILPKIKN